jgi:hypothetical protein
MALRLLAILLSISGLASAAAKKTVATARGENEDVILNVTIYIDPEAVKSALGDDLGGHFIVAEVKFSPKYTKELTIDRDDFQLRTDKDGEHSKPMAPSQVAGSSSLVLTRTQGGPSEPGAERNRGWSVGGMGGGMGSSPGTVIDNSKVKATMKNDEKENPLKKSLDAKVLPEKKVEEPVTGFLFFPMENQKMKDLELQYGAKENRIRMRFK